MCVAIYKPAGFFIPERVLKLCWKHNRHGMGFAFPKDGIMKISKGYFNFDLFLENYRKIGNSKPMLIHFRYASAGAIDQYNCHPWRISDQVCMIHNGTLNHRSNHSISDTGFFTKDILIPNRDLIFEPDFQQEVEFHIGERNKMAFLRADDEFIIYNEHSGEWMDGIWYSNTNFLYNRSCNPNHYLFSDWT